ncbi:PREDICTED: laminin subunit alpha-2-like, partial [Priapulus caudatus]|uniref:Laminin subunit alpha-2-like n=1 Tax=Priapulus caudatus TaxID=37621 RepID=A0ABM1EUJ9_PRICU
TISVVQSQELGNGNGEKGLFPVVFNLAAHATITSNATCGIGRQETYCKLVEHVPQPPHNGDKQPQCAICSANSPREEQRHLPQYAIDGSHRWWQSPSLANSRDYNFVTVTLDLGQIFQVAYIIVKAAASPRPGNWILERSTDGIVYKPWQYYAMTDSDCWNTYGIAPTVGVPRYRSDDEVICTSYYSKLEPLENGEIHTSLVNGRPGVVGPSATLTEFTSARYVRLRLQRIRTLLGDLMHVYGRNVVDTIVSRRYFYSIKDISIGGQCICSGHADECRHDPGERQQKCECQHNTCGDSCNKCCPLFNQFSWRPGTAHEGFVCEECQCFGHADRCVYNKTVAVQQLSQDITGVKRGGGVCINCQDNTVGYNCESCREGYYRPAGVPHSTPDVCQRCDCRDRETAPPVSQPGNCICKTGFAGPACDRCAIGFRGYPYCEPCPCDPAGSRNYETCDGECDCKPNTLGQGCDSCKPGYFNLAIDNPDGCQPCFCFGATDECTSVGWSLEKSLVVQIGLLSGWSVTDLEGRNLVIPTIESRVLKVASYDTYLLQEMFYWSAPPDYLGNKGHEQMHLLRRAMSRWTCLEGPRAGGPAWKGREQVHLLRRAMSRWTCLEGPRAGGPAWKGREQILLSVSMEVANENSSSSETLSTVEQCDCPYGYTGLSCEQCDVGWRRVDETLYEGKCERCRCHGHADACDAYTGECLGCQHDTIGPQCEQCRMGFYGDPQRGTASDCKACACPLTDPDNNFSSQCERDPLNPSDYICTECPQGFVGNHCEMCSDGYFGDPLLPGNYCQPCLCNGNVDPQAIGNCDRYTGQCLKCIANSHGWSCDQCQAGYYGTAINHDCSSCDCNAFGSVNSTCDRFTGQCRCKPNIVGRQCERCADLRGNLREGCEECNCNEVGSAYLQCDFESGQCQCKSGVFGRHCDTCNEGYYGFSDQGCQYCDCDRSGSTSQMCDQATGQCTCRANVTGRRCDQCFAAHWNVTSGTGCVPCGCNLTGADSTNCDQYSGQCSCKPGIGGAQCNKCEYGYYGFSVSGCKRCPRCDKPGHVCDAETGQCVCPLNTEGDRCERCRKGTWGYNALEGCKVCSCDAVLYVTRAGDTLVVTRVVRDTCTVRDASFILPDLEECARMAGPYAVQLHRTWYAQMAFVRTSGELAQQMEAVPAGAKELGTDGSFAVEPPHPALFIEDVMLDYAVAAIGPDAQMAVGVEQCDCPPEYQGSSCQNPAPGYFRWKKPNFLDSNNTLDLAGEARPCMCNYHSSICDRETGICINCKHNTAGDHCELCASGYYGNATYGTPYDCDPSCDEGCPGKLMASIDELMNMTKDLNISGLTPAPWLPLVRIRKRADMLREAVDNYTWAVSTIDLIGPTVFSSESEFNILLIEARSAGRQADRVSSKAAAVKQEARAFEEDVQLLDAEIKEAVSNLDKFLQGPSVGINISEALKEAEAILIEINNRKFRIDKFNTENELEAARELYERVSNMTFDPLEVNKVMEQLHSVSELLEELSNITNNDVKRPLEASVLLKAENTAELQRLKVT